MGLLEVFAFGAHTVVYSAGLAWPESHGLGLAFGGSGIQDVSIGCETLYAIRIRGGLDPLYEAACSTVPYFSP